MPQTQDMEKTWRFDIAMPAHLQELVRRTGQPDLTGARSGWLLERGNAWFSKPDFILFETDEQLEGTFYTCAQKGHGPRPHMWGVFVVQGPSIPQPTIIGIPGKEDGFQQRPRSGHPQYWATWHGKEEGYRRDLDFKPWIVRRPSGATPPRTKKPRISEPPGPIFHASYNREGSMISASRLNSNSNNKVCDTDTDTDNVSTNDVATNNVNTNVANIEDGDTINAASNEVNIDNAHDTNNNTDNVNTDDISGSDEEINVVNTDDACDSSKTARDAVSVLSEPREVNVRFLSNSSKLLRERPWASCNSAKLLFVQAMTAKIVEPGDNAAALSVRVPGYEDIRLVKNDEKDFECLRILVEDIVSLKFEYSELSLDIDVVAMV
jgi:hypothetical protein